jgi:plastocyanin
MRLGMLIIGMLCFVPLLNATAEEVLVNEEKKKFPENTLYLKVGDTLVLMNQDKETYYINIIGPTGDNFVPIENKGAQEYHEKIKHTFTKPGEYYVRCRVHPKLRMKVLIAK